MSEEYNKRTKIDIIKDILFTIVVLVAFFVYWCLTLAVISIIFMSVWKLQWMQMGVLAAVLAVVSTVIYTVRKIKKRWEYRKVLEGIEK